MQKIEAFIFDLDGVIVDTAKYHFLAWKNLAESLDIPFTIEDNERLKGISRFDSLEIILQLGNRNLSAHEKNVLAVQKNTEYVEFIKKMTAKEILPGVVEFLDSSKKSGLKIALGSASKNAPLILERLNIEDYFDVIIDGNTISKSKPNPEVFLKGAEALNIPPENCVVFEDAQAGVEAAKAANMKCVGIGVPEVLSQADFVLPGFKNITGSEVINMFRN